MYPKELRYTSDHEWARKESDGTLTVGLTQFAVKQLGEVVFVEVYLVGRGEFSEGEAFGSVESVKAVSEIFLPVGGEITTANPTLSDSPETLNDDCYGEGWVVKMKPSDPKAVDGLMTAAKYEEFLKAGEDD